MTVQTKCGKEYDGILTTCQTEGDFNVVLAYARLRVKPDELVQKPVREMVFLAKDLVQVIATDVDLFEDDVGAARKNQGAPLPAAALLPTTIPPARPLLGPS